MKERNLTQDYEERFKSVYVPRVLYSLWVQNYSYRQESVYKKCFGNGLCGGVLENLHINVSEKKILILK